jgi:hypothetical protein
VLGLLAGLLAGCATDKAVTHTSWLSRLRGATGPTGPDVVRIDAWRVECRLGDPYINQDLWALADEQVVSLETKARLEQNGFRVGQVGGITPAGLQKLLDRDPNGRHKFLHANNPVTFVVGPRATVCRFEIRKGGEPVPVELAQAECTLSVVPTLTDDGRTRLRFTPVVPHGEAALLPGPARDRTGWELRQQQPKETYAELSWEVTVGANEFIVVGGRADKPGTLGHASFLRPDESIPVQRLLVLSAGRSAEGLPADGASEGPAEFSLMSKSPPLAVQAALTGARGVRP